MPFNILITHHHEVVIRQEGAIRHEGTIHHHNDPASVVSEQNSAAVKPGAENQAPDRLIEEQLLERLRIVSDWLKYAEAKNVALLAFTGAGTLGLFSLLKQEAQAPAVPNYTADTRTGVMYAVAALVTSLVLALLSFVPNTNHGRQLERLKNSRRRLWTIWAFLFNINTTNTWPKKDDNLYYYGDLVKYLPEELVQGVGRGQESVVDLPLAHTGALQLAAEVIVNAIIARRKYAIFRVAAYVAVAGMAILAISAIWSLAQFQRL